VNDPIERKKYLDGVCGNYLLPYWIHSLVAVQLFAVPLKSWDRREYSFMREFRALVLH
jgi:hypothetical protein